MDDATLTLFATPFVEQEVDDKEQEQSGQPERQRRPPLLQKPDGFGQGVTTEGSQNCYRFGDDEHTQPEHPKPEPGFTRFHFLTGTGFFTGAGCLTG